MTDRNFDATSPDGMPPLAQAIPLGLQHVLAMFAGNITVPIIIAGVMGSTPAEKIFLIQVALFVSGIATLIQTIGIGRVGARLPIVQGTSFGFLPIAIPIAKTYGLGAVFGGALIGGLIQVALGVWLQKIRRWFPPLVTGIVVLVIGLLLIKVSLYYVGGGKWLLDNKPELFATWQHWLLAGVVLGAVLTCQRLARGFWRTASILVGIVVGYLVALPLGMVDFGGVANAAWFAVPTPLQFGIEFPLAAIVGMAVMALITTIETIGDISGITVGGADREATDHELAGGIMADGVGTSIAAVFGALPNTSYSQNVGLIAFTRMMSRHVVTIGALFLVAAGLMPKLGAVVSAMPNAVLGGASIIMFGMIASAGIRLLVREPFSPRNMLIVAICLTAGVGLPLVPEMASHLPSYLALLVQSGLVPAAILAIVLNAVLPQE